MRCCKCKEPSVFLSPNYCKSHFLSYFEKKALETVKRFKLFNRSDNICVAVSGGKDSMSLLYLLNKHKFNVSALAIDEGISGYRDKTLLTLKLFCKKNKVRLEVYSFKKHFKKSLDEMLTNKKLRPCTVCGVFRRNLLNLGSRNFDVIATGHNLDDEAQAVVMNLLKCNLSLLDKLGPVSGTKKIKGLTRRVKPFYLLSEKEIMAYSYLNNLNGNFSECPNVGLSFRLRVRDILNEIEMEYPGTKANVINWFLKYKRDPAEIKDNGKICSFCGEPSMNEVCSACRYSKEISEGI